MVLCELSKKPAAVLQQGSALFKIPAVSAAWEDPVAYKQLMKEREEAEKSFEVWPRGRWSWIFSVCCALLHQATSLVFFGGDTATFHGPQRVSRTSTGTQEAAPTHCCCRGDLGRMKILVAQEDAKYHNGKGPDTHLDRDLPKG